MNILFLNDTTISRHAGSIATVHGIYNMLNKRGDNIYSLPVGYGYPLLAECRGDFNNEKKVLKNIFNSIEKAKKSLYKINSKYRDEKFNNGLEKATIKKHFNADAWYCAIEQLKKEPFLDNILSWSDMVIINGEGTIHHNYYGSQVLLALAFIAREYNKPTLLINSTIESIDNTLVEEALSKISYISVRDDFSKKYLESFSINCFLHPDAAFSNDYSEFSFGQSMIQKKLPNCLISSGIEQSISAASNLINIVKSNGYKPTYCCFDSADDKVYRYCRENNINVIHYATIPWWCFPSFLNQFDLCISGRHHLNVFCILGKIPFIPLGSNTWKIQGTLDLIDYQFRISKNAEEIESTIQEITGNGMQFNDSLVEETITRSKSMVSDFFKIRF